MRYHIPSKQTEKYIFQSVLILPDTQQEGEIIRAVNLIDGVRVFFFV